MKKRFARCILSGIAAVVFAVPMLGQEPTRPVRHYIFDRANTPQGSVASTGVEKDLLRLPDGQTPQLQDGRKPGNQLFVIDGQAFQGQPFDAAKGFTIEVVFRYFGQGRELGNGRPNGMIFAQGDGYWHGLRLYCETPTGQLRFEMGRPQPQTAFGISSPVGIAKGIWQHVAVSWDRQQLRLYWNGVLTAAAPYTGSYTAPNGPLRIGFADAGIGSLQLQVAEWIAYPTNLPPEVIAAHALSAVPGPIAIRDTSRQSSAGWGDGWKSATEAAAVGNWREAEKQWS
jgi:hypothetical protein